VKLIAKQGYKSTDAARRLGICRSLLDKWRRKFEAEDAGELGDSLSRDEREELTRLRRENRELRMEREILKKAAAFFAKESN
jgi:transposase